MKLYVMPGACSFVPHTALEWAGADYGLEILDHDSVKSDEYKKINPQGTVPAVKDGDTIITQNVAVQNYINATYPDANIFGVDGTPASLGNVMHWLSFLNADVHKGFAPLFSPSSFVSSDEAKADLKQHAKDNIANMLKLADKQLSEADYLTGVMSTADIYLYVILRWVKKFEIDLDNESHFNDFIKRIESDDAVQRVLEQEGMDKIHSL